MFEPFTDVLSCGNFVEKSRSQNADIAGIAQLAERSPPRLRRSFEICFPLHEWCRRIDQRRSATQFRCGPIAEVRQRRPSGHVSQPTLELRHEKAARPAASTEAT